MPLLTQKHSFQDQQVSTRTNKVRIRQDYIKYSVPNKLYGNTVPIELVRNTILTELGRNIVP